MRIVVLGVSGMLGSKMFRLLGEREGLDVIGTARSAEFKPFFAPALADRIVVDVDATDFDRLAGTLRELAADVVINCIGVVKQRASAKDPRYVIPINAVLPHELARYCEVEGSRLIHFSTDCVFDGRKGNYREDDPVDADDLYGQSKARGEVDYPNAITLRTSMIGRELANRHGLLEWFLAAPSPVYGYTRAVFSGPTSDELARVVLDHVLPRPELHGIYHVSAAPISKFDLLQLIKAAYPDTPELLRDETVAIDRSLNSARFRAATGYTAPSWPHLIEQMRRLDLAGS